MQPVSRMKGFIYLFIYCKPCSLSFWCSFGSLNFKGFTCCDLGWSEKPIAQTKTLQILAWWKAFRASSAFVGSAGMSPTWRRWGKWLLSSFQEGVRRFAKLFEESCHPACTPPALSAYLAIHVYAHPESKEEVCVPAVLPKVALWQPGCQTA